MNGDEVRMRKETPEAFSDYCLNMFLIRVGKPLRILTRIYVAFPGIEPSSF